MTFERQITIDFCTTAHVVILLLRNIEGGLPLRWKLSGGVLDLDGFLSLKERHLDIFPVCQFPKLKKVDVENVEFRIFPTVLHLESVSWYWLDMVKYIDLCRLDTRCRSSWCYLSSLCSFSCIALLNSRVGTLRHSSGRARITFRADGQQLPSLFFCVLFTWGPDKVGRMAELCCLETRNSPKNEQHFLGKFFLSHNHILK
jgi:hypothetical protein